MVSLLKPIIAVRCPAMNGRLTPVEDCNSEQCPYHLETRMPWRHYAVKCDIGDKREGVYP